MFFTGNNRGDWIDMFSQIFEQNDDGGGSSIAFIKKDIVSK